MFKVGQPTRDLAVGCMEGKLIVHMLGTHVTALFV